MDGLNVEHQQTRVETALKTGTFRVTQQNAASKNADWKSVLGKGTGSAEFGFFRWKFAFLEI